MCLHARQMLDRHALSLAQSPLAPAAEPRVQRVSSMARQYIADQGPGQILRPTFPYYRCSIPARTRAATRARSGGKAQAGTDRATRAAVTSGSFPPPPPPPPRFAIPWYHLIPSSSEPGGRVAAIERTTYGLDGRRGGPSLGCSAARRRGRRGLRIVGMASDACGDAHSPGLKTASAVANNLLRSAWFGRPTATPSAADCHCHCCPIDCTRTRPRPIRAAPSAGREPTSPQHRGHVMAGPGWHGPKPGRASVAWEPVGDDDRGAEGRGSRGRATRLTLHRLGQANAGGAGGAAAAEPPGDEKASKKRWEGGGRSKKQTADVEKNQTPDGARAGKRGKRLCLGEACPCRRRVTGQQPSRRGQQRRASSVERPERGRAGARATTLWVAESWRRPGRLVVLALVGGRWLLAGREASPRAAGAQETRTSPRRRPVLTKLFFASSPSVHPSLAQSPSPSPFPSLAALGSACCLDCCCAARALPSHPIPVLLSRPISSRLPQRLSILPRRPFSLQSLSTTTTTHYTARCAPPPPSPSSSLAPLRSAPT